MTDKLGPTGTFPSGKLTRHDEGALNFAIGEQGESVVLKFGEPVAWMGMTPEQAVGLAELLIKKARVVARRQGKPLTVRL